MKEFKNLRILNGKNANRILNKKKMNLIEILKIVAGISDAYYQRLWQKICLLKL